MNLMSYLLGGNKANKSLPNVLHDIVDPIPTHQDTIPADDAPGSDFLTARVRLLNGATYAVVSWRPEAGDGDSIVDSIGSSPEN